MSVFTGAVIAVSGTHKGYTQAKIEKLVADNGGTFAKTIDDDTTHLVTTEVDFGKKTNKVKQALENNIHIVALAWLTESIEKKKREDEKAHAVTDEAEDDEDVKAEDKEATPVPDTNARGTKRRAAPAKKEESEEPEPPAKKTKKVAVGKGKAKAAVKDEEDDEPVDEPKKAAKMKTVIKKGKAPVDEYSGLSNTHHVYVDAAGLVWDACLNQTQISANANKFYYIQLLENDSNKSYATFTHWGRVGEKGQNKMICSDTSLSTAQGAFEKQFKAKTGRRWDDRADASGGGNKYAYLERNYEDDDDDDSTGVNPSSTAETLKIPESKIAKPLQDLVRLIFNQSFMQQSMASMSYDANKLPLGKLSKETILKGYNALKQIGLVMGDSSIPNKRARLEELTNQYYSIIPHDFGRNRPVIIESGPVLKKETELIDNLTDMKITAEILASSKQSVDVNLIDSQYNNLGLNEATPLDHSSDEFKYLCAYLTKTHGTTHHLTLQVEDIFRITRSEEVERWDAANFDTIPNSNRKLLWHGSRTTNYSGILSQGLRIAPPEAPVSGYMFDKGIYLADIATKSANYCYANISNNTGLLMLCEAQLGDPMLELKNASYTAAKECAQAGRLATKGLGRTAPLKWEDAGVVNENLKGVEMPKVSGGEKTIIGPSNASGLCLEYNEYIVYNVNQVKIRYLFRCKFGYGRGYY